MSITSHFRFSITSSFRAKYPDVISAIRDSFHVDDMISGGRTVDEAFKVYNVARQVMLDGGFNLRKWNSNSPELPSRIHSSPGEPLNDSGMNAVCEEGKVPSQLIRSTNQGTGHLKLLGIVWNSESDHFTEK